MLCCLDLSEAFGALGQPSVEAKRGRNLKENRWLLARSNSDNSESIIRKVVLCLLTMPAVLSEGC